MLFGFMTKNTANNQQDFLLRETSRMLEQMQMGDITVRGNAENDHPDAVTIVNNINKMMDLMQGSARI